MVNKKKHTNFALPKAYWIILAALIVIVIASTGWFLFWRSGWPSYHEGLEKCGGHAPVQASTFITRNYRMPGDKHYLIPGDPSFIYYCTEKEAIDAGFYRKDSLN